MISVAVLCRSDERIHCFNQKSQSLLIYFSLSVLKPVVFKSNHINGWLTPSNVLPLLDITEHNATLRFQLLNDPAEKQICIIEA